MADAAAAQHPGFPLEWWDALEDPAEGRYEVIRGALVVSPSPQRPHQRAAAEVWRLLDAVAPPQLTVELDMDWRIPGAEPARVAAAPRPDVVVWPAHHERVTDPVLAVEVLSPSDHQRLTDSLLTRAAAKRLDYATGGLPQLIEVDLAAQTITRYELTGGVLTPVESAPRVTVQLPGAESVTIDIDHLRGPGADETR
jgi:Uma2 family endonuclease